jgi:5,10-methylenetetrahydromethanopterin reductase
MTNAAAIATLVSLAGRDRVVVAVGSGFTGRYAMGKRPLPWASVARYVRTVQGLLRGDEVEWDGATIQMIHPDGYAPGRPIEVPFLIGAAGPKGIGVAREVGDGVFGAPVPIPGFDWSAVLTFGTVLDHTEDPGCDRAVAAAGHAAGVILHWAVEQDQLEAMLPELGPAWAAAYDDVPRQRRHLALHDRHLVAVNERDRPFVSGPLLASAGLALTRDGWKERIAQLEAGGATEIAYQPAGPDIPRELAAFADAFHA